VPYRIWTEELSNPLASTGNDVIMDYPLTEQWRVADLLETWTGTTSRSWRFAVPPKSSTGVSAVVEIGRSGSPDRKRWSTRTASSTSS
jgi:hypothetical protein